MSFQQTSEWRLVQSRFLTFGEIEKIAELLFHKTRDLLKEGDKLYDSLLEEDLQNYLPSNKLSCFI